MPLFRVSASEPPRYGTLSEFLAEQLFGRWSLVVSYDLGRGMRAFAGRDGETVNVTCSFGVAQHRPGDDQRELFAAADRALYRAKRAGKNRVELEAPVRSF